MPFLARIRASSLLYFSLIYITSLQINFERKKAEDLAIRPRLKKRAYMGFKKGRHSDIKDFRVLYKKGRHFSKGISAVSKRAPLCFRIDCRFLWLILSFCPLVRSTPAGVKREG